MLHVALRVADHVALLVVVVHLTVELHQTLKALLLLDVRRAVIVLVHVHFFLCVRVCV